MGLAGRVAEALRPTESEYRANLTGLNTFFGAVLGFVISDVERLDTWQFAHVLLSCSAAVIAILYVSASKHRVVYALVTAGLIFALPAMMPDGVAPPDKLQATLAVWAALTFAVELLPRKAEKSEAAVS